MIDFEIPKKYGLRQTIADTLGIGGIFRTLRRSRSWRDFARDMEKVLPQCADAQLHQPDVHAGHGHGTHAHQDRAASATACRAAFMRSSTSRDVSTTPAANSVCRCGRSPAINHQAQLVGDHRQRPGHLPRGPKAGRRPRTPPPAPPAASSTARYGAARTHCAHLGYFV